LSIDLKTVGEATGLGTLPAVGASPTKDFTSQALSGVGDAEGSMDKNLEWKAGGFSGRGELGKFTEGEFTSKNGQGNASATGKGNAFG
jgi:hypothetical protein